MKKYLVVFLLSLWHEILAEEYSIQRRLSMDVLPDRFVLPPSMCYGDVSGQCNAKGGKLVGRKNGCTCECMEDRSTFGIHNSWKCINNTIFHHLGGCSSLRLNNRYTSSPIITITRTELAESYLLPTLTSLTDCGVTNKGSKLTCSGTWRQLNSRVIWEIFDMQMWERNWYLHTKRSLDDIEGQVIRLNIECQSHQYCVIFKVNGTLRCPLPPSPSQSDATVSKMLSTTQVRPRPPSSPIKIATITTTSAQTRTTTSLSVKNRKKSASKESDKSGLITGALAGIIGLAIIVIAIMVMMKRHKKRNSDEQRTDTVADNAGYGRGEDYSLRINGQQSPDKDEYSFAAPFVKTSKQNMECHPNNHQEFKSSVANQAYGQTDELNQKASAPYNEAPVYNTLEEAVYAKVDKSRKEYPSDSDAPIYNTLEEPEYAKVDKSQKTRLSENHNKPLYNVLEGPELTSDSTLEGLSDEPPCYQVLEGPFSEGAPVYDVIEGPESVEAPVYGAFEGQDPHVYGALDKRDGQRPLEQKIGYNDIVYDSVGDVINDQGDIYQELNQNGQQNSDVYQALNYPGN